MSMDRDGLRQAVQTADSEDYMLTDAQLDVIMQLAEDYARSVCLEVIGSTEPIPENKYNSMIEFEAHTKGKVRNALRAEQQQRLEEKLQ
jgi:hypothetical protein